MEIKGYTLHGRFYLADKVIPNKSWKEAIKMKEVITLPNGKTVVASTLSRKELKTIPQEERGIGKWYWTSTPDGDGFAWFIGNFGVSCSFNINHNQDDGGARLGFKNPFIES